MLVKLRLSSHIFGEVAVIQKFQYFQNYKERFCSFVMLDDMVLILE